MRAVQMLALRTRAVSFTPTGLVACTETAR